MAAVILSGQPAMPEASLDRNAGFVANVKKRGRTWRAIVKNDR